MSDVVTDITAATHLDEAVPAAVRRKLLCPAETLDDFPLGLFYDLDAFDANLARLRNAFPSHWHHATAVKTNPLSALLRRAAAQGHGLECASVSEVMHALECGVTAADVVYDSPCKTAPEIRFALEAGVHLNVDNVLELERVRQVLSELPGSTSVIGVRINPLVGAGAVQKLSVSTRKSKFGIPCPSAADKLAPEMIAERAALVEQLAQAEFITCIHVHTGSGGMGLQQMVDGCAAAVRLAKDLNALRGSGTEASAIDVIDIGGGLPVSWGRVNQSPSFEEYAEAIRVGVPELFDASQFRRVVTEFGAAMNCKFAWLGSVVEVTKPTDRGQIAMIHAGSDIFLRQCYASEMRQGHPVRVFDGDGMAKAESEETPLMSHDIAGPLCFAGDVVSPDTELPRVYVGDIVVLEEAGGNTLSMATSHCSRRRPPVYGYTKAAGSGADAFGVADDYTFVPLSAGQTYQQALSIWSG